MKELILNRILEIQKRERGFPRDTTRWRYFMYKDEIHISRLEFEALDDEELLKIFERLIRQMSKVM